MDGEHLLARVLGDAGNEDEQLRALHRAIEAAVALPLDVHVAGEPLSCLSGYGSCLWQLGRCDEAQRALDRVLRLDPADHQGMRPLLSAVRAREPWRDSDEARP